jgi:hypothetical protein
MTDSMLESRLLRAHSQGIKPSEYVAAVTDHRGAKFQAFIDPAAEANVIGDSNHLRWLGFGIGVDDTVRSTPFGEDSLTAPEQFNVAIHGSQLLVTALAERPLIEVSAPSIEDVRA